MSQKSILEQALLQVQTLEEAVKQNAKGILASTMKQELSDLLKESLEEEEDETPEEEGTNDMSDEESDDDTDLDNEPSKNIDSMDSEDDEDMSTESDMDSEDMDSEDMNSDDENVMDMTGADHEEVLKVFKAMKPEDGIIVKKDGDEIEFNTGDDEYIIKLDDETSEHEVSEYDMGMDEDDNDPFSKELSEEDETIYEIDLDDTDDTDGDNESTMKSKYDDSTEGDVDETFGKEFYEIADEIEADEEEGEFKESAHTMARGYHGGLKSKKVGYAGNTRDINEEVTKLKKQNAEYKKALVLFKEKLNEVAVFNANLAYATRLFTESSTTKQEKLNILKRFDSVSSMNESKNLFKTINNELENKKPITESVVEKISTTKSTSSSEVLSESKAYENPQFKRMKDLMSKLK
jgi:hypothetical protein